MNLTRIRKLVKAASSKMLLLVLDGLGGLPQNPDGETELEAAHTPNLDALAGRSVCGLHQPVGPGITPGSGPGHLGLFGYDPIEYQVGRGVLAALGIDFDLRPEDLAARGNFCTIDAQGQVTDRRAGRIGSDKNRELCRLLRKIQLPDVEVFVETVKQYRFLLVLRGKGLSGDIDDTDPQQTGRKPFRPDPKDENAGPAAQLVNKFLDQAAEVLADRHPANMVLLRGFSKRPDWPRIQDIFGLNAAAVAAYPMYRGLCKLIGMHELDTSEGLDDEIRTLRSHWEDFDYFFLHVKATDSSGEDGDFERKAKHLEQVDARLPQILDLAPDVVMVTGDHSTPSVLRSHSWHPVPVMLWSKHCRPDAVDRFGERACMRGGLGPAIAAVDLMPLAMANALRLEKFGA